MSDWDKTRALELAEDLDVYGPAADMLRAAVAENATLRAELQQFTDAVRHAAKKQGDELRLARAVVEAARAYEESQHGSKDAGWMAKTLAAYDAHVTRADEGET